MSLKLLNFYYCFKLLEFGACFQTKRKAPGNMERVMINKARYRKIRLNPGFAIKNVVGNLWDSVFGSTVQEEADRVE